MAYGGLTKLATLKIKDGERIELWHGRPVDGREYWEVSGQLVWQRFYAEGKAWSAFNTACHHAIQNTIK